MIYQMPLMSGRPNALAEGWPVGSIDSDAVRAGEIDLLQLAKCWRLKDISNGSESRL